MAEIKQIKVPGITNPYDISAKYIQDGSGNNKSWSDITSLIDQGFDIKVLQSLPEANATSYSTYKKSIVLIPDSEDKETGAYIENVIIRSGTSGSYTYAWEPIGTTKVDLSGKVDKGVYTTSEATGNTGQGGEQQATVSGSITYTKAATITGSAGGATVEGSNFSFEGTKASFTLTQDYQPAGTVSKPNVNLGSATEITYVNGVKSTGGTATVLTGVTGNGTAEVVTAAIKGLSSATTTSTGAIKYVESFTHSGASLGTASTVAVLTGVTGDGSDTAIKTLGTGSFFNGATVTNGILSFNSGNAYNSVSASFTALKGVKANGTTNVVTGYPNFSGGAATPTTKYLSGTALAATDKTTVLTGVKGNGTATVILSSGLSTATFNNYTSAALANAPVFTGTTATLSVSGEYTPAGTIGGSQVIPGHTHSVGSSSVTATYSLKAAVSNHTHSLGNHTHSVDLSGE